MESDLTAKEFAARSWRVDKLSTLAERSGSGQWSLKMKYRTSDTHVNRVSKVYFRSSDDRYGNVTWATRDEALHISNVQAFRDFVQVGWANAGGGGGGGSADRPKRPREWNAEHGSWVNRVPSKLRSAARSATRSTAVAAASASAALTAQASRASTKMARLAGLFAAKRKDLRFANGAVERRVRKAQRREEQERTKQDQQLLRSTYRQEQIAILTHAITSGSCDSCLVPLEDAMHMGQECDVSRAQSRRALIQCMVLLEYFGLLEACAQDNNGFLPEGHAYELADKAGTRLAGKCPPTHTSTRTCAQNKSLRLTDSMASYFVVDHRPTSGTQSDRAYRS